MAEKSETVSDGRRKARLLDLDVSAVLIAERLVGEILGWDRVDWSMVEPHKTRKFFFGRQRRADPSIHNQLKPLLDRCDPAVGDFSALKPSPVVNTSLTRLVGHLCRHMGEHHLPQADDGNRTHPRTVEQERLHCAVVDRFLRRIGADSILDQRADDLKHIAGRAESELEIHFADLINARLESSFLPGGTLDRNQLENLKHQARTRVMETQAVNAEDLAGFAMPALVLDRDDLVRIEMAKILLSRFPYVRNYELMLFAELAMLQQPLVPRLICERRLAGGGRVVDADLIARWDAALADIAPEVPQGGRNLLPAQHQQSTPDSQSRSASTFTSGQIIAICGSGPLPLSALFLHLLTGVQVILIDQDRAAVERSTRLIGHFEKLEILPCGALTVQLQNAGDIAFHDRLELAREPGASSIRCDAVMIASLVDIDAKASIATHFQTDPAAPEFLITRSATGLSARLAYDSIPTELFSRHRLAYCGETMPATHVTNHLSRLDAIRGGLAGSEARDLLAIAHPDVVNTTEVYRRMPPLGSVEGSGTTVDSTIDAWLQHLEKRQAAR